MQVLFGNTSKRKNSTFVPSPSTDLGDCVLKSPTSVVTPTFELWLSTYPDFNYCYVPQFHRYYFIVDIVSTSSNQWDIMCVVDVLATYRTGIMGTTAFVERAQSAGNSAITDGNLPKLSTFRLVQNDTERLDFLDTPPFSQSYILSIAGQGRSGFATSYVLDTVDMVAVVGAFYSEAITEKLNKKYTNPLSMVAGLLWCPFKKGAISGEGSVEIKVGDVSLAYSAPVAQRVAMFEKVIIIELPYFSGSGSTTSYADYRNVEPFTTCEMFLPGVGFVDIPLGHLIGDGSNNIAVKVRIAISPVTGTVSYILEDNNTGSPFMNVSGRMGVTLPVSGFTKYTYSELGGVIQAIGGLGQAALGVGNIVSGNPMGIAIGASQIVGGITSAGGAAMSAVESSRQNSVVSGAFGGYDAAVFNAEGIRTVVKTWPVSGSANALGRPYYNTARLGSFSGYVKCSGAYVGVQATDQEHNMLMNIINGGFYIE